MATHWPRVGKRRPRLRRLGAPLALAALVAPGCQGGGEAPPAEGGTPTRVEGSETATVELWFYRGESPAPTRRAVPERSVGAALEALVAGPTAAEREQGLTSWFSPETRDAVRRVEVVDGFVVVDFTGLPQRIPNAGTSAGSEQLLTSLDSTVLQFLDADSVEYRLDGSCDAFWGWLQRPCTTVRRP